MEIVAIIVVCCHEKCCVYIISDGRRFPKKSDIAKVVHEEEGIRIQSLQHAVIVPKRNCSYLFSIFCATIQTILTILINYLQCL